MSTRAHEVTRWIADQWEGMYPSAVFSGIVGDASHKRSGGYHISREDNPPGNYSITRADDKLGPSDLAAAIDMSMSPADMKLCTSRLKRIYDNSDDPRRKFLNAFNGWLGTGNAKRWDISARVTSYATDDHKWHIHAEQRRRWVTSLDAAKAFVSALAGQSAAQYLASTKPNPTPTSEDPVSWKEDVIPVSGDPKNPTWQARNALGHVVDIARNTQPRITRIDTNSTKALTELATLRAGQATLVEAINKLAGGQQLNTKEVLDQLRQGAYEAVREAIGDSLRDAVADSLRDAADAIADQPATPTT